jgi:hypothetical protein
MAFMGAVEGDPRGFALGMASIALEETGVDTGCEQMGGGGMPQGRDGDARFGEPGTVFGGAEGALDPGAPHGPESGRTWLVITPSGRKEPGGVTMGLPGGA